MPALDRNLRFALAAVLVGGALLAFFLLRGGGDGGAPSAGPLAADAGAAGDPWASADPTGRPDLRRGAPAAGARLRGPGPPVRVTGVVRVAGTGTPVAGAEVAFLSDSGESIAIADDAGRYAIDVASRVRWKVHARTDDAVGYPEIVEVRAGPATRDLEVARLVTIQGTVIDNQGAAVVGADVTIEVEASARPLLEAAVALATQSDQQGRFVLRGLPGHAKLRAARGMAQGLMTVGPIAPGATLDVQLRVLWPVRLRGQVVDRASQPQAGASIKAVTTLEAGLYERRQLDADASGRFDLELPAGAVRLEAWTASGERAPVWYRTLVPGASVDDVRLVVGPGEILRGRVTTADGGPVVAARVRLASAATYSTSTGSDGHFEVTVPERIPYLVKIDQADGYLERRVDAWGDDEAFVLPRFGSLTIRVAGAAGDASMRIDSLVPAGEAAARLPVETSFRGSRDLITVDNLEPGRYRLTVSAPASATVAAEVDVPPAAGAELSVNLAASEGPPAPTEAPRR